MDYRAISTINPIGIDGMNTNELHSVLTNGANCGYCRLQDLCHVYMIILVRAYNIYTWRLGTPMSQHNILLLGKTHKFFLCSWRDSNISAHTPIICMCAWLCMCMHAYASTEHAHDISCKFTEQLCFVFQCCHQHVRRTLDKNITYHKYIAYMICLQTGELLLCLDVSFLLGFSEIWCWSGSVERKLRPHVKYDRVPTEFFQFWKSFGILKGL